MNTSSSSSLALPRFDEFLLTEGLYIWEPGNSRTFCFVLNYYKKKTQQIFSAVLFCAYLKCLCIFRNSDGEWFSYFLNVLQKFALVLNPIAKAIFDMLSFVCSSMFFALDKRHSIIYLNGLIPVF